jgi:ABC-type uncharacterized transport system permease subunit
MQVLAGILNSAVGAGTVIVFAALGELLAERTGVFNLGIEGVMCMGAVTGMIAANLLGANMWGALLLVILVGILMGVIYAVAAVSFRTNQILAGLAMSYIGTGLAKRIGVVVSGVPTATAARFFPVKIPVLSDLPLVGYGLFDQSLLAYAAYTIFPLGIAYILFRTRHGMNMRAVGENPAAAAACGINVTRMRFFYVVVGSAMAAIGGAVLTLSLTPSWIEQVTAGRGWIAIALVIFGSWNPFYVVLGALLFGAMTSLSYVAQVQAWSIPTAFLTMSPYVMTLLLMIIPYLQRGSQARKLGTGPAALGLPFYHEES